jgi:hypothetical protein
MNLTWSPTVRRGRKDSSLLRLWEAQASNLGPEIRFTNSDVRGLSVLEVNDGDTSTN